jgi:hypothetical protein
MAPQSLAIADFKRAALAQWVISNACARDINILLWRGIDRHMPLNKGLIGWMEVTLIATLIYPKYHKQDHNPRAHIKPYFLVVKEVKQQLPK